MRRLSLGLVLFGLHCSGQTTAAPPAGEVTSPPAASAAPVEATSTAPAEPAPTEAPAEKEPVASPGKTGSSKPECAKLPKTTCKVTSGCAWNDLKKCVSEGP